jgi:hypothetical protein
VKLNEVEAALRASPDLQKEIVRDVGMFTVALFAVFGPEQDARLELAGTGTLVSVTKSHYILTARHVWEERLRKADKVGITLRPNVDHCFLVDVKTIVLFGPPPPPSWGEWGPDLVFLYIPPEHVGTIKAFRVFYELTVVPAVPVECLETLMLMGAPYELGEFTKKHADLQICGFFMNLDAARHNKSGFDYVDPEVDLKSQDVPKHFGGTSGGGLWHVYIQWSRESDKIDSVAVLEGVVFYELPVTNGRRIIRCHGKKSIAHAIPKP